MSPTLPYSDDPVRRAWSYQAAARPGRLFFTCAPGWLGRINRWYQRAVLGRPMVHADHVGIIGPDRSVIESSFITGGARIGKAHSLDDYLGEKLRIARLVPEPDGESIARGLTAAYGLVQESRGYDLLSLATVGLVQSNGRSICSELVSQYLNEVLRNDESWTLVRDQLVLPDQILALPRVEVVFA